MMGNNKSNNKKNKNKNEQNEVPTSIVIDNGSSITKAGFSGQTIPQSVFSSTICAVKEEKNVELSTDNSLTNSMIINWDNMEQLWQHTFNTALNISPTDYAIFFTEPSLTPSIQREKMTEIIFEKFNVDKFYVSGTSSLTLYAAGKTTGLVMDCGHQYSSFNPICEGYKLPFYMQQTHNLSGSNINNYLIKLLTENGMNYSFKSVVEINKMKEDLCYVALDYKKELEMTETSCKLDKIYQLPDGKIITLNSERFQCTELLFQPDLIGLPYQGIHHLIYDSIMKTNEIDKMVPKDLFKNIVVSGGSTLFNGFSDRLLKEMKLLTNKSITIIAPDNRNISVWIGGSILCSLSSFQTMWITKDDYNQNGPSIVHKKCVNGGNAQSIVDNNNGEIIFNTIKI